MLLRDLLAFTFTSPGRILFEIGPITVRWYGLLIAIAVLVGASLSQVLAKRRRVDPDLLSDLSIWLVLGGIPGARLYYVLFQWSNYAQHPQEIIAIWNGGIAIHGAIIGATIAAIIFAKLKRVSFWQLADLVVPSLALGQAIGRWGNFFNSEAFGSPTDLPWKLFIPSYVVEKGFPIYLRPAGLENVAYYHPTFLYESIWNLMVFGMLMLLFVRDLKGRPKLKVGTLFLFYLVAYGSGRVWIEALRTDSLMFGGLKVARLVSLGAIAIGLVGLGWLYGLKRSLPDVVAESTSQREV
ncbi:MAG: prolipoprotein diacylglyceryl transferase [Alkalinema sp. RU_4_3]|nr:prolipoprotein diacylglyceryl transferase [Alkalinema sp. RU_4_3]